MYRRFAHVIHYLSETSFRTVTVGFSPSLLFPNMVAISDIQLHLPRVADKFEYDVIVLSYSNLVFLIGLFSFNHVYFKTKPSKVNYFF